MSEPYVFANASHYLEEAVAALTAAAEAGDLELPGELVAAITAADTLGRGARDRGRRVADLGRTASERESDAQADLIASARDGTLPGTLVRPHLDFARERSILAQDLPYLQRAAAAATRELGVAMGEYAGQVGQELTRSLHDTLTLAAKSARHLDGFAFGDPMAFARASKAVQAAFAALEGLTGRHARLEAAIAAMDALAGSFAPRRGPGLPGIGFGRPSDVADARHPVARLAAAASAA